MTVEERAQTVIAEIGCYSESSEIRALIVQALRDQIEDCARVADVEENKLMATAEKIKQQPGLKSVNHAAATQVMFAAALVQQTGVTIRALAAPTESETDDNGPDDRFDIGGFECNEPSIE